MGPLLGCGGRFLSFKGTFRSVFERFFAEMNEFQTVFCGNARVSNGFCAVSNGEIRGERVKMGKICGVEWGVDGFEAGSVWIRIGFDSRLVTCGCGRINRE